MSAGDCERWAALSDRLAVGEPVCERDQAWLAHHARGCPECAREAAWYASLRESMGRPEHLLVPAAAGESSSRRGRGRRALVAALAMAAGIALAIGLWRMPPRTAVPATVASSPASGRLLYVAGKVEAGGDTARAGHVVSDGEQLVTGDGRTCAAAAPSITVCLDAHSAATVALGDPSRITVYLERGRLLARLDRQPAGRRFAVRTAKAEVQAVGTRFSVGVAGDGQTEVRLHEGKVALRAANQVSSDLTAPAQASVGDEIRVAAMPEPGDEDAVLSGLSGLSRTDAGTVVRLDSRPSGADVMIDDVAMGKTPLSVVLASAAHVRLSLAGYAPVSEWLSLGEGPVERMFNLTAIPVPAEAAAKANLAHATHRMSPGQLLAHAQAMRARGAYDACAQLYRRLWSDYPASEEAKVSMVSLGELELGQRNHPGAALEAFTAYLRTGGPLEREARFGRIRALRALGRDGEAERDGAAFLRDYPTSVQAAALRRAP